MMNPRDWFKNLTLKGKLAVVGAGVAAVLLGWTLLRGAGAEVDGGVVPTALVERGPLTIGIVETGTIKPQQQEIIKNEVEGQTTLLYLIPEGTVVKKGDLLVELDSSRLKDDQVNQQITLRNAESNYIRAREQMTVTRTQAEIDLTKARQDYQFAQDDLKNYINGQYPRDLKESQNKITLAKEQMEQAKDKLGWSERLFKEKYISQTEFESDRLSLQRSQLDYDLAVMSKGLLEDFTHKRKLQELETNVDQMRRAMEKTQAKTNADIVQAEADLSAKQAEFERQKGKLEKLELQIVKTKIYASREGMVVYASSVQGSNNRGGNEPLAEGQNVRERQELIYMPTTSAFNVEIKIHESSLEKARIGQPVRITIDALPGKAFAGKIQRIAPLPDATSVWLNPDLKVYSTMVQIEDEQPELRTGMSCKAEVVVEQHEDALYVPVNAILRVNGEPTAWVMQGGTPVARTVKIGLDNSVYVHVREGLQAGERVLTAPPLEAATAGEKTMAEKKPIKAAAGKEIKAGAVTPTPAGGGAAAAANSGAAASAPATPGSAPAVRSGPEAREGEGRPRAAEGGAGSRQEAPAAGEGGERPRRQRSGGMENMTPEQREEMRKRIESMSPEEREKMREQWRKRREAQEGQGGAPGAPGAPAGAGGGEGRGGSQP